MKGCEEEKKNEEMWISSLFINAIKELYFNNTDKIMCCNFEGSIVGKFYNCEELLNFLEKDMRPVFDFDWFCLDK